MLSKIVYEIVQSQPVGIKHAEVVKRVLRSGYEHQGTQPLSIAIYDELKRLVLCGAINRIQNELLERSYKSCDVDCHKHELTESCF